MRYSKVHDRIWLDPAFKRVGTNAKLVFMYLITCPMAHLSGLYYMPRTLMAEEIGLKPSTLKRCMKELSAQDLAHYDDASQIVFVRSLLKYQGRGPKIVTAVMKQLEGLPHTPLKANLVNRYSDWGIPYPIDTPPDTPCDGASLQKQKQKTKTESEIPVAPQDDATPDPWDQFKGRVVSDAVSQGDHEPSVSRYLRALEETVEAYYASTGGTFTPTRRKKVAKQLATARSDHILVAIEVYADRYTGMKDERYFVGIVRGFGRNSPKEFEASVRRHRSQFRDVGLHAGVTDDRHGGEQRS